MAIINRGGGMLVSTGSAASAVTVEKTQQVYGVTIPISSGRRAVYGHIVWMDKPVQATVVDDPAREWDWTDPVDGTTDHHEHSTGAWHADLQVDFAVSFGYHLAPAADRAATGILRMWANDKLIFDAANPLLKTDGVDYQFYDGSATQGLDAVIRGDRGTLTPSFHNMIYIRFSKWSLDSVQGSMDEAFRGRNFVPAILPVIRVELVDGLTVSTEEHSFTMLASSTIWGRGTSFDWDNNLSYAVSDVDVTPAYVHTFSISDELEISKAPITGSYGNLIGFNQVSVFDKISGSLITGQDGIGNTTPIAAVNVKSGAITGTFGVNRVNLHPSDSSGVNTLNTTHQTQSYPWPKSGDLAYLNDGQNTRGVFAFRDTFDDFCLLPINSDGTFPALVGPEATAPVLTSFTFGAVGQQAIVSGMPSSLKFPDGSSMTFVSHIPLVEQGVIGSGGQDGVAIIGVAAKIYAVYFGFRGGAIGITGIAEGYDWGAGHLASQALIDPTDTGLVVFERNGSNVWTATKFRNVWASGPPSGSVALSALDWRGMFPEAGGGIADANLQILWQVSIPAMSDEYAFQNATNNSELESGTFAWKTGSNTTVLNLSNGSTQTVAFAPSTAGADADFVWDSRVRKFYYPSHGGSFTKELWVSSFGSVTGATKTIGDYLKWIALKIGFLDANIYVDPQLTDPVIGMLFEHAYNSGTLFDDLGKLYDFQHFESENKIKFVRAARGDSAPAPVFDLTASNLVQVQENNLTTNDLFVTQITEPAQTIANVTVSYDDVDINYNWATQTYIVDKQTSGAVGVGSMVLQTPVVMGRKEAYKRASQVAIRENAASDTHFFRLSQKYMRLEPSDVIAVTIPPFRYKVRIDEGTLNADWTTSYSGINYSFQDNIPDPTTTHEGVMDTSFGANDAKPLVFDVPLLKISYNVPGNLTVMVGVQSYGQTNFAGSTLFSGLLPPGLLTATGLFPAGATAGIMVGNGLPPTDIPFQTDETSVITVALRTGTSADFASTDATGLLQGKCSVLVGEDGRYEYVYFRDVTVVNSKVVKLSGLERGRRGTDVVADSHVAGDRVVLVTSVATGFVPPLAPQVLDATIIDSIERYMARGIQNARVVSTVDVNIRGMSLYPWNPVQQSMAFSGGNDLLIQWIRRDRLGDEWITNPQPMSEATEKYDLEILNGSTVVRTVTGLTTPQYTYTSANQSTDGFTPPLASLRIKVYQVSAVVGRGFVGDATIFSA